MRRWFASLVVVMMAVTVFAQAAAPKPKVQKVPAKYTSPASGQEMYEAYCASCHGKDAKGKGPAAPAMKATVPDLTMLAKNNGGKYPSGKVYETILGSHLTSAHGSADMPVWGPVFLKLGNHGEAEVQQRAHNLTTYLESRQIM